MPQTLPQLPEMKAGVKTSPRYRIFFGEKLLHERTPPFGVLRRIAVYLGNGFFNITMDADEVAIGKRVRKRNLRLDEFIAIKQTQLIRNR